MKMRFESYLDHPKAIYSTIHSNEDETKYLARVRKRVGEVGVGESFTVTGETKEDVLAQVNELLGAAA